MRDGLIYQSKLDKRHRWEIGGTPDDMERAVKCRICGLQARVYGSAWLAKWAGRAWASLPRSLYFSRFLHPGAVERGGKLVIVRHRSLASG